MKHAHWLIALILFSSAAAAQDAHLAEEARKALALTSGHLAVRGLERPVRVLRDRWGVAHIFAESQHDLFLAQGFVAAQDRLFQMELWKRAGQGRLSELLGRAALARDVSARELSYRGDLSAEYASYAPEARQILEAFTAGINAYIESLTGPAGRGLPIEFRIAGFAPQPWRPEDCLNRMAAFSMTGNATAELGYARALKELGASKAAKIVEFDPPVALDPDPKVDLTGLSPSLLKSFIGSDQRIVFPSAALGGSNNWTIGGALTSSGRPLLANDPHRVVGLPSLRYLVHLVAPGWNVIGAGEPGLPGVALGHNEHIAWGFTIFGLDQQDLYVEELNPANPREYRTEAGWQAMQVRRERFAIKGAAAQVVELSFTRHGPVVWQDGRRALALRWVGSEPGTAGYLASLSIDRAQNWDEFEAAAARWKVPSENLVYADRAGNIGEHSVGLAPLRDWTGLLPVAGAGGHEWRGFVPVPDLPHVFNPARGFVATANHKMIPEHYPYNVGFEWEPPYRIRRIEQFIGEAQQQGRKLGLDDMASLQNDVISLAAVRFIELLRSSGLKEEPGLAGFLNWNGSLSRESGEAALYEVWFREIGRALAKQISAPFADHYQDLAPNTILRLLASPDEVIFGKSPLARRDELLRGAWSAARRELARLLGADPSHWRWGRLHRIEFRHALDERSASARALFDLEPFARPGDEFTVDATGVAPDSWEQIEGASYREIIDTSDWDRSLVINTPGQSGQPTSPHYSDLARLWDAGRYFPLLYTQGAIEAQATEELTLEPPR